MRAAVAPLSPVFVGFAIGHQAITDRASNMRVLPHVYPNKQASVNQTDGKRKLVKVGEGDDVVCAHLEGGTVPTAHVVVVALVDKWARWSVVVVGIYSLVHVEYLG